MADEEEEESSAVVEDSRSSSPLDLDGIDAALHFSDPEIKSDGENEEKIEIIPNGFCVQDNSSREPSQMLLCDYGTFHLLEETTEGQMLVSQTTSSPSDRICYHFLEESDGTQQVLQSYDMEKGIALVLINHQSDYSIPKLELPENVPVVILTYENGTKLRKLLCQCKKISVFCSINTMDISEDIEVSGDKCLTDSAKPDYYETFEKLSVSEGLSSIKDRIAAEHQENRQFFPKLWSTSKPKGQPIANHIESALYPNGLGICITEDWKKCLELFDFFHALQPLERKFSDLQRVIFIFSNHRDKSGFFEKDFLFYLALSDLLKSTSEEGALVREFSTSCCKKVQGMDIPKVALSVKRFLKQCSNGSKVECTIKEQIHKFCTDALPLEDQKHPISPFYVYNRFLWTSLALKFSAETYCIEYRSWGKYLLQDKQLDMLILTEEIIKDISNGILLTAHLDIQVCPDRLITILVSEHHIQSFIMLRQFICKVQSSILLAADRASDAMTKKFANKLFLKYKKWIDSACKNASSDKTLWKEVIKQLSSGTTINVVIDEALDFLDCHLKIWELHEWQGDVELFDNLFRNWCGLLISMTMKYLSQDVDKAVQCLLKFSNDVGKHAVLGKYQKQIEAIIIAEVKEEMKTFNTLKFSKVYCELQMLDEEFPKKFLLEVTPANLERKRSLCRITEFQIILKELCIRHQDATKHGFISDFFLAVMAPHYGSHKRMKRFFMDLLEIEITKLFKKNGTEICQDFTDSLLEIIQQNALEEIICENFSKILKHTQYTERHHFRQQVLSLLSTKVLCHSDDVVCEAVEVLKSENPKGMYKEVFCWDIVHQYCLNNKVKQLKDISQCQLPLKRLLNLNIGRENVDVEACSLQCSCAIHAVDIEECQVIKKLQEGESLLPKKKYVAKWLLGVKHLLLLWKHSFQSEEITKPDIKLYQNIVPVVKEAKQLKPFVDKEYAMTSELLQSYGKNKEKLRGLLLQCSPSKPKRCCYLIKLLRKYKSKLNETALVLIDRYVRTSLEDSLYQSTCIAQTGLSMEVSDKITLCQLKQLVSELNSCLEPVYEHLPMMVFFEINESKLFEFYMSHSLKAQTEDRCKTVTKPALSAIPMLSMDRDSLGIQRLKKALVSTQKIIRCLLNGKAKYEEITCGDESDFNSQKFEFDHEFAILLRYADENKVDHINLESFQSMLELFSLLPYLQSMRRVFETPPLSQDLHGCYESFKDILNDMACIEKEDERNQLTQEAAVCKLTRIKCVLGIPSFDGKLKSLELFQDVSNSIDFWNFLKSNKLDNEEKFYQIYDLVKTHLQQEEYNELVLNRLQAAYKIMAGFMNPEQTLMSLIQHVLQLAHASDQLRTVNEHLDLIGIWFAHAENEPPESIKSDLQSILEKGCYFYFFAERHTRRCEIKLCCVDESSFHTPWERQKIDEFIIKLGFLEDDDQRVQEFQRNNEAAYELTDVYGILKELGHPSYTLDFKSSQLVTKMKETLVDAEIKLAEWKNKLKELHSKYTWLPFLSVKKVILVHNLLSEHPTKKVIRELRTLQQNDETIGQIIEMPCSEEQSVPLISRRLQSLLECNFEYQDLLREQLLVLSEEPVHASALSKELYFMTGRNQEHREGLKQSINDFIQDYQHKHTESAMDSVGNFLNSVSRSFVMRVETTSYDTDSSISLHSVNERDLIHIILAIFDKVPHFFQVFHCQSDTNEEELELFFSRSKMCPDTHVVFPVSVLSSKLQERILCWGIERKVSKNIHFIETSPSLLNENPEVKVMPHLFSMEKTKEILKSLLEQLTVFCVYGLEGNGKSHFIERQLALQRGEHIRVTIHEGFSPKDVIKKLRLLPSNKCNCGIFFNFTLLPPGCAVDQSVQDDYKTLLQMIGWFFFDLLILGYVEDRNSGMSFHLPVNLQWTVYVEVPVGDATDDPRNALEQFYDDFPVFALLGNKVAVDDTIKYEVDAEVQLVCKYLKAYDERSDPREGIDKLYVPANALFNQKEVKVEFGSKPKLLCEECHAIMENHMQKHIRERKVTMKFFMKYMYYRCSMLDSAFPAFTYNQGISKDKSDTRKLGSTLMKAMLKEVNDLCDPAVKKDWSSTTHQQLIFDFGDGGSTIGFISLDPESTRNEFVSDFKTIGCILPPQSKLRTRCILDRYLCRTFGISVQHSEELYCDQTHLSIIDENNYVLTLDYTMKMLSIHERYKCGVPVILQGETGVGKTALVQMLSKIWNYSLKKNWEKEIDRLLDKLKLQLEGQVDHDITENYDIYHDAYQGLKSRFVNRNSDSKSTVNVTHLQQFLMTGDFSSRDKNQPFLISVQKSLRILHLHPVIPLLINGYQLMKLFERSLNSEDSNIDDTAEAISNLFIHLMDANLSETFFKVTIHSGLTAADIRAFLIPKCKTALECDRLKRIWIKQYREERDQILLHHYFEVPSITVFFDEVNTSSCCGILKEIIFDHTVDGMHIPKSLFIMAACNPHRGNSTFAQASLGPDENWLNSSYYVRQLHPSLKFLMWDYGALSECQELEYIRCKMAIIDKNGKAGALAQQSEIISESQIKMREYAKECLGDPDLAKCCVSQRDIQRVFTLYEWLMDVYKKHKPCGEETDYSNRALLLSVGVVYYLRLSAKYRKRFAEHLKINHRAFLSVFEKDLKWFINKFSIPSGVAKTEALKENLFTIMICTMTKTPVIILGEPGSSKTLSFSLAVSNLRGAQSKNTFFRQKNFPALDPQYYQGSRRTTADEIDAVVQHALIRQRNHECSNFRINCVVFLDEAGLPPQRHEALKVLHPHLDSAEVSFVLVSNHVLDAAKTNRAISVVRPKPEDLDILARGCFGLNENETIKVENRSDVDMVVSLRFGYRDLFHRDEFKSFFGLRDFIHLVHYLRRRHGGMLTPQIILQALERNFNGTDHFDSVKNLFLTQLTLDSGKRMSKEQVMGELETRTTLEILQDSLNDCSQQANPQNEVRYKLIVDPSEDDSLARLLFTFDLLKRTKTHIFVCSNFPGDSSHQKINTISAIRHAAAQGHTVLLSQAEDVHESFYDLFNLNFHRVDEEDETRFFANVTIGAHLKPSKVGKSFQCVVLVKQSEVEYLPPPFLSRFEKFKITHKTLFDEAIRKLSPNLKKVFHIAISKVEKFVNCVAGPKSLYGYQEETLYSLFLTLLPAKQVTTCDKVETYPDDSKSRNLAKMLKYLRDRCGLFIPKVSNEELEHDACSIFQVIPHSSSCDGTVCDYDIDVLQKDEVEIEADNMFNQITQQWIIRHLCKTLMQIMTPEAIILHHKKLPLSYLENYLVHQNHFSLHKLIKRFCELQDTDSFDSDSFGAQTSKLLCYTRSSSFIHKLPATYVSNGASEQDLLNRFICQPSQLMICKLSPYFNARDFLGSFIKSPTARVLLIIANMQETSKKVVNHLRILIEESEKDCIKYKRKKLFVVLLHFPSAMFFAPCYPTLFLRGWSHHYLDTIGYDPTTNLVDIGSWFKECCISSSESVPLFSDQSRSTALQNVLVKAEKISLSWAPFSSDEDGEKQKTLIFGKESKVLNVIIFDLFASYWKSTTVKNYYLKRAVEQTNSSQSTLNITQCVEVNLQSIFLEFVFYIFTKLKTEVSLLDIAQLSQSEELLQLFHSLLKKLPLLKLYEYKDMYSALIKSSAKQPHPASFPFFKTVYSNMMLLVEQCMQQSRNILGQELKTGRNISNATNNHLLWYNKIKHRLMQEQSHEVECVRIAIKFISHDAIRERYWHCFICELFDFPYVEDLNDHPLVKLTAEIYFKEIIAEAHCGHQKYFIYLHLYGYSYKNNFPHVSQLLRSLMSISEALPSSQITVPLKSPDEDNSLCKFIISCLFNYFVKESDKPEEWHEVYTKFVTMPFFHRAQNIEMEGSDDPADGHVVAQFNVMHVFNVVYCNCDAVAARNVTKSLIMKVKNEEPLYLEDVGDAIHDYDVLDSTKKADIIEEVLEQFFSPHKSSTLYKKKDIMWFLKIVNKQSNWEPSKPIDESSIYLQFHLCKKYLLRVLLPDNKSTLVFKEEALLLVEEVLSLDATLGEACSYIPYFWPRCSEQSDVLCHAKPQSKIMNQPLAHLFFLALSEYLQIEQYHLSDLVQLMEYTKKLKQDSGSKVILYIQAEAVFLAMLQCVGSALDCGEKQGKLFALQLIPESLNAYLENRGLPIPCYGWILVLHHFRKFLCMELLCKVFRESFDSICNGITCLTDVHSHLKTKCFGESSTDEALLNMLQTLDANYPKLIQKEHLLQVLNSQLPGLRAFAAHEDKLKDISQLLQLCIRFHQVLHTQLAYQITAEQASVLEIGLVVELMTKYSMVESEPKALYDIVKVDLNEYLSRQNKECFLTDETKLIDLLYTNSASTALMDIILDMIKTHNDVLTDVTDELEVKECSPFEYLYQNGCSIIEDFSRDKGKDSYFMQLVRSRVIASPQEDTVSTQLLKRDGGFYFDCSKLLKDFEKNYILGKPKLSIKDFLKSFDFIESIDVQIGSRWKYICDLELEKKVLEDSQTKQDVLDDHNRKRLHDVFHSATFQVYQEVITILRSICGCLNQTKVQREDSENLGSFKHLFGSQKILNDLQQSTLKSIPKRFVYSTLELFVTWFSYGLYDFCDVPLQLKVSHPTFQPDLPEDFSPDVDIDKITALARILKQQEVCLSQKESETKEYLSRYCGDLPDDLKSFIPDTILVEHYVDFQITMRRIKAALLHQKKPSAKSDPPSEKWIESAIDQWKESTSPRHQKKQQYGFNKTPSDSLQSELERLSYSAPNSRDHSDDEVKEDNKFTVAMTCEQVGEMLERIGLKQYREAFENNGISGNDLADLDHEVLEKELGVKSKLHRNKILRHISKS